MHVTDEQSKRPPLMRSSNIFVSFCHCRLAGNPDRGETTRIKKRLSAIDDTARACDDDSDDDINLNVVSSIAEEENVFTDNLGRPDTASKSESLLSSPIDGWDLSPDGIRTSGGLESPINERNTENLTSLAIAT